MKNSAQVLLHLVNQPQYKKLEQQQCISTIQGLFPPHLQNLVLFAYVRHKVLYFVFSHPGAKQEFDIIISSIKTPLKLYPPSECQGLEFEDIVAYVSHKPINKMATQTRQTVSDYEELSKGEFINNVDDKKLHKIIEDIRKSIQDKKHD